MDDLTRRESGRLAGRTIAILMESDYVEPEIHYYRRRFAEEGAERRVPDPAVGPAVAHVHRPRVPRTVHCGR